MHTFNVADRSLLVLVEMSAAPSAFFSAKKIFKKNAILALRFFRTNRQIAANVGSGVVNANSCHI